MMQMRSYMLRCSPMVVVFWFMACHSKVICPAFQSTFILDDTTREAFFSYVWQLDEATRSKYLAQVQDTVSNSDSSGVVAQPKTDYHAYAGKKVIPWRNPKRTRYGVIKYRPNWLKNYRMRTAPMENVFSPKPVENDLIASDFDDSQAIAASDSTAADSLSAQSATAAQQPEKEEVRYLYGYDPKDDFNVEQEYYNKYYGEKLIDNRPPAPPDSLQENESFFERIFKSLFKRKIQPSDTTEIMDMIEEVEIPTIEATGDTENTDGG